MNSTSSSNILTNTYKQRWSRGHKARGQGQGHKKNLRPRSSPSTALPRTDPLRPRAGMLEAKDQGHKHKCFPKKKVSPKIFQGLCKNLTIQKIVLSSSRRQAIFEDLKLRGQSQGLDLRGQGLQNLFSKPRTSSRTPPLLIN